MWPLAENPKELFLGGRSLAEWIAERGVEVSHPWELLDLQAEILGELTQSVNVGEARVDGILVVGEGTRILPGVFVEGVVMIGRDCKIGPNCYLRGATSIGDGCHVGQAVELKNSIIGNRTAVGHLSYIGDSILADGVNLGAGTITSNLRHDGRTHRTEVNGELVDTGRRKFGTVIGAGVHTGIHTSIYPGRKIGPGLTTRPGEVVSGDLTN